jgi:hypothetical protein
MWEVWFSDIKIMQFQLDYGMPRIVGDDSGQYVPAGTGIF